MTDGICTKYVKECENGVMIGWRINGKDIPDNRLERDDVMTRSIVWS